MNEYVERRARFSEALGDGVAVIFSARDILRNGDSEFRFRQDSDFYYLTGFDEPDAVLVLSQRSGSTLFLRANDESAEIWNGKRVGIERAPRTLNVENAYAVDELESRLPDLLVGASRVYYDVGRDERFDRMVFAALHRARERTRKKGRVPDDIAASSALVGELRLYKSAAETELMRRAAAVTAKGFDAAMRATRPGLFEYQIQALLEHAYMYEGASGVAYTSIVAAGENATTLHYVSNRDELRSGDLLLVDSGSEYGLYASDVTRTWPIDGRFSPEQRAIYEIVLAAQKAAINRVRPGEGCRGFHETAVRVLCEGLIEAGLLQGSVDEAIETERYREYYMHGTGHWLGLDVHDAGRYRDDADAWRVFEPGMVTTVEPGIYIGRNARCDERFKGIGVRIEDDILVTADGNENLTAAIPKEVNELESVVGDGVLSAP